MTEQEKYLAYLRALKGRFQKLCRLRFLNPDGSTACTGTRAHCSWSQAGI